MSATRTIFHVMLVDLLKSRAPSGFEIWGEVQLATEPQRADVVIVRREADAFAEEPRILKRFWAWVLVQALLEYKSPSRSLAKGDLARLLGYAGQYSADHQLDLPRLADLILVWMVPSATPTLDQELARAGWKREGLGGGYYQVKAAQPWPLYVVVIDEVSKAEQDAWLALVGNQAVESPEAQQWLTGRVSVSEETPVADLEGFEAVAKKALAGLPAKWRVEGLKPEERNAGLTPEERLADIPADHQFLALSTEALAMLPAELLQQLPPDVRSEIQRRLARARAH